MTGAGRDPAGNDNRSVSGGPFILLSADDPAPRGAALQALLRRMGLRPEPVARGDGDADGAEFQISIGRHRWFAGPPTPAMAAASTEPDVAAAGVARPDADAIVRCGVAFSGLGHWDHPEQIGQDREFFKLLALLIDGLGAKHLFWSPARLWSDAGQFRAAVAEMVRSGMPPILHLIAFTTSGAPAQDGADQDGADQDGAAPDNGALATRGLFHFVGQELAFARPVALTPVEQVRRLARLSLDILVHGPIRTATRFPGLDASEVIVCTPDAAPHAPTCGPPTLVDRPALVRLRIEPATGGRARPAPG